MKKTDFIIQKGTLPVEFKRGVQINGKIGNITVVVKLNQKKRVYGIENKWNYDQITGEQEVDQATVNVIGELMMEAQEYCIEWRKKWLENQPKEDPNQLEIGLGDGEGNE